ncbi:MAG: hypothetical protein ABL862_03690 [Candidatus Nitrotoga sp.]
MKRHSLTDSDDKAEKPIDKYTSKANDRAAVAQWRAHMVTEEVTEIYKLRASVAECVNAQARLGVVAGAGQSKGQVRRVHY